MIDKKNQKNKVDNTCKPVSSEPRNINSNRNTNANMGRRNFIQTAALGGVGLSAFANTGHANPGHDAMAYNPLARQLVDQDPMASNGLLHPAHPFWPAPRLTLITDHKKHRSRNGGLVILKDKWLFFWREANHHSCYDPTAVLKMGESYNGGQVITNIRTIYDEGRESDFTYTASDLMVRKMANGRIGLFAMRVNNHNDWKGCIFMYSDDEGKTWSSRLMDDGFPTHPGFSFIEYPASVGGHDTEGFIIYFKSGTNFLAKESFVALYTTDNGDSWSHKIVMDNLPNNAHEMSVIRLGDTERWIMIFRQDNRPDRRNAVGGIARSEDMLNWDGPYNTNTPIAYNPSTIVYNKGYITWICASRPNHYREGLERGLAVNGEFFQGLATKTAHAEDIWKEPKHWPEWSILIYLPVHFDGTFVNNQGHWYMIFGAVEGPMRIGTKTYSQLGLMSSIYAPGPCFNSFQPGWMFPDG